MQYRVNPKNGERISALGLGCMRFPGALGRPDQRQARDIISRAVERYRRHGRYLLMDSGGIPEDVTPEQFRRVLEVSETLRHFK